MYNLIEIKQTCDRFIKAYNSLEELSFNWIDSKASVRKTINALFSKAHELNMPETYWDAQASLFADSQMFTEGKVIKKILRDFGAFTSCEGKQALSFWTENPGFWCFYSIKETLEDDFFIIEDLVTGLKHLMHSPDITFMQTKSLTCNKHYLSLMLPNGSCLQTVGFPKFNLLSASDMQFYFSLFSPGLDLGSAINRNFIELIALDAICSIPVFMERKIEIKKTWQPFKLKSFDISELAGTWDSKELGKQQKFDFVCSDYRMKNLPNFHVIQPDTFTTGATLVRDTKTGEMALTTRSNASYTLFAALLNRTYPGLELPKKPAVSISMALNSLLSIGDYTLLPWKKFFAILELQQASYDVEIFKPEASHDWKQDLRKMQGSEKPFDIRHLTARPEANDSTYISVHLVDEADKPFELSDLPEPPKGLQDLFGAPLGDSVVFEVRENHASRDKFNTLTNNAYANEIAEEGLAAFITALFVDYFPGELGLLLMNSFLWILYYKGKESIPARSYAIELLKMQPYPLTDIYFEREAFLRDFTKFIKKILCTRGICSLSSRPKGDEVTKGTYTIKGTDAFYSLIKPAEYRVY